ncbi:PHP domain-containing protein [Candidatus Micrarchaeota archaeon]|nr:PHP domain-containing protein [Candidatus Micrarchaeota archaeon]MBD3417686.1 PHP domain-containing protein [Candidatus Micrarchaeota archaeon]
MIQRKESRCLLKYSIFLRKGGALLKVDFHVHTNYSFDATIKVHQLAERARQFGIIPAITDHYSMKAIPAMEKQGTDFIPGEELRVTTPLGKADLIGLFLNEEIEKNIDFEEALDRIKEQGAISYAPHPFDSMRAGLQDESILKKVQIIEVFNAHCLSRFDRQAEAFAKKEGRLSGAGSDAHFIFEFGQTYVELELDELEPSKLLKALKNGKIVGKRTSKARRVMHRIGSKLLKPFI